MKISHWGNLRRQRMDAEVTYILLLRKRESEDLQKEKVDERAIVLSTYLHRKSAVAINIVMAIIYAKK
jgi:hypothetical protein